jgi:hypothetical protein
MLTGAPSPAAPQVSVLSKVYSCTSKASNLRNLSNLSTCPPAAAAAAAAACASLLPLHDQPPRLAPSPKSRALLFRCQYLYSSTSKARELSLYFSTSKARELTSVCGLKLLVYAALRY